MIYFVDNFLPKSLLDEFLSDETEFVEFDANEKSFWVKMPSDEFQTFVVNKLQDIEGKSVFPILGFFREAKEGQDNSWRIHNDDIILGEQPDRAVVLFMESENSDRLNGTAFWEHKEYGDVYTGKTNEDYDKLMREESENIDAWTLRSVVGYKQNRLVSYPCKYFHSKYPNEFTEPRRVYVLFYKVHK